MSVRLFKRASDGSLVIASYTSPRSYCWVWSISLSRIHQPFYIAPRYKRRGQWHHFIPLLFGTLIISRQDFHRDPRHQVPQSPSSQNKGDEG